MDKKGKSQVGQGMSKNLQGVWKKKMLWQKGCEKPEMRKKWKEVCYILELSTMFSNRHKQKMGLIKLNYFCLSTLYIF